jgi:hypothetical protein
MQMIDFLRNFFTKGLEIHSSFYRIFQIFEIFNISNLKKINFYFFFNFQN